MEELNIVRLVKRAGFTVMSLAVGITAFNIFTVNIDQGHEGVVFNKQHGVEKQTLNQGLHVVNPLERITAYPISTETVKQTLKLSTKDGKPLKVEITYDYHNDPTKLPAIYNKFKGQEAEVIEQGWLQSRLKKSANSVTSKHTVLDVFQKTDKISLDIEKAFQANVGDMGFMIESVTFGTPEPDANTQQAIQNVVNAQQEVEKIKIQKQQAQLEAEKKKITAEGEAQKKLVEAKAEADSIKIKADAQAEANKKIQQSLTKEVLENNKIQRWNGVNSTHILGDTGVNINTK